jgi:hypothetical protein
MTQLIIHEQKLDWNTPLTRKQLLDRGLVPTSRANTYVRPHKTYNPQKLSKAKCPYCGYRACCEMDSPQDYCKHCNSQWIWAYGCIAYPYHPSFLTASKHEHFHYQLGYIHAAYWQHKLRKKPIPKKYAKIFALGLNWESNLSLLA